jgi:hypothetical protein
MRYIGKLVSNGKIFDSNIGKKPFDFRLGELQLQCKLSYHAEVQTHVRGCIKHVQVSAAA